MTPKPAYTTQLQAGLGLVSETKTLLELWQPGMTVPRLYSVALESGRFSQVTARRLRNVVTECFAPRYLADDAAPARHLKRLLPVLGVSEANQLLLLFTSRANAILGDFVREVYWPRYAGGNMALSTDDARKFVARAIDEGKTGKRWSESTTRRVAAYLTGCCADYGLLETGTRSVRRIRAFRLLPAVAAYLAYDLRFRNVPDNALLTHHDWGLFGMSRPDVLGELKQLALKGLLLVQAAGEVVRVTWKFQDMDAVCDVLAQS